MSEIYSMKRSKVKQHQQDKKLVQKIVLYTFSWKCMKIYQQIFKVTSDHIDWKGFLGGRTY